MLLEPLPQLLGWPRLSRSARLNQFNPDSQTHNSVESEESYLVSVLRPPIIDWAAARRAIGMRYGEHDT